MPHPSAADLQLAFDRTVENLAEIDADPSSGRGVQSVAASSVDGFRADHAFYEGAQPIDLRSVSKVVVALTIGAAIDRKMAIGGSPLSVDMPIAPFFEEYVAAMSEASAARFRKVTVAHLMSNTMGHDEGFLFRRDVASQDKADLLTYIFSRPLDFEPGEHFSYSNVGWYLISAMIRRHGGSSLQDWATTLVLDPIDVCDAVFENYGAYEIGASGIRMSNASLQSVGRLFIEHGQAGDRRVVSDAWLHLMRSAVHRTSEGQDANRLLQHNAYGFALWSTADGVHYCDGSAGQFLGFRPSDGFVISVVGNVDSVTEVVNALAPLLAP